MQHESDMGVAGVAAGLAAASVEFRPAPVVAEALARFGRTEDVRFSPANRLLAIAGYHRQACLFLRVEVGQGPRGPFVAAADCFEIASDGMRSVHGVDFVDARTVAVANRDGKVAVLELPADAGGGESRRVPVLRTLRGSLSRKARIKTPGSLAVSRSAAGRPSILVCNNYVHTVTRHVLSPRLGHRALRNETLAKNGLDIPDGIAVSHDGRWIAVSSHGTRDVKLYDAALPLGPEVEPAGVLRQANYPHGLRFTADDRHIVVADAASQNVYVYARGDGWSGPRDPIRRVAVLDRETFLRGHNNPEEGGPKGLDIDRTGTVLAVTCEEQQLAFFSLASVLGNA